MSGKVTQVGFREWLVKHADAMGARGWIRNLNRRTFEAVIHGPTDRVAPLIASCILGPETAMPTSYGATVIQPSSGDIADTFTVRDIPRAQDLTEQENEQITAFAGADDDDESSDDDADDEPAGMRHSDD